MHRRLMGAVPIGVLLFAGLLVAGCGSSSSSTTTTTTAAISKAEFVAKGNAICVAGQKAQQADFTAYAKKHGFNEKQNRPRPSRSNSQTLSWFPTSRPRSLAVKALGAPSGEEQQVSAALEASQQALDKVKANPELGFAKASPFHAAGQQLHALGLTQCAKNT